ncbi:hypothetical protein Sjap_024236 [Stephania japonica]|uniref:SWI/SNF-related matrix-associated actin-dependent regulator of chromatin subfamily A member 3-like 1 n=1 Tax=Stephania japonica TaxID=461633 RepID=A0AAP0ELP3_9MAGN
MDDPNLAEDEEGSFPSEEAETESETFLIGFVIVNVVGLQHYSGTVSGREMVGLVREPLNPYDPNAIKVQNTQALQVGHIERASAAVLAPLIDARLVTVEAIVPNLPRIKHRYKLPCQVHIFARPESFSRVRAAVSRSPLSLISDGDASFGLSEAAAVKEKRNAKGARSVDEVFKLVGAEEDRKGGRRKKTAMEPPRAFVKTELLAHQKEGLGWLVARERTEELPPFWEQVQGGGVYVNVLTNYQTNARPEPLRGGIFADDMGLGKTLTLLSLIAVNTPGYGDNVGEEEVEEVTYKSGKRAKGKRVASQGKKRRGNDNVSLSVGNEELGVKTTLIVCPLTVFTTWITQLDDHTRSGSFKVYMYYGERTRDVRELQSYDIVLTTYSTLATELDEVDSPIKMIEWYRVILDEAHLIKNVGARQSKAVIALKAKRRWAVTGTPIQNGSFDLFSLMAFLKFEPFSIKSYWQRLVQNSLNQGNNRGLARLQVLMATISLRRIKENSLVGLPPKTLETCYVELLTEERDQYDHMEVEAKTVLRDYISVGSLMHNYSTVLSIILRLRQICDDMALCPSDIKSMLSAFKIGDASNKPELLEKILSVLQDGDDFDCPICISPPVDMVITCCAHLYCRACILKAIKRPNANCPLCRRPLSQSDLFSAPQEPSVLPDNVSSSGKTTSSKVSALMRLLKASRSENSSTKSVVFSQFRKMLLLLEEPLKEAGFRFLRLDGSMTTKKRAEVIEKFQNPGEDAPTVMLASLKASGAGINLTAASRVYLLEPWWNPAVEEQAMDRVHRIGQTEDVKVVRLIVKNSIEERILKLQERKKELAREAFRRKSATDRSQMGAEDIRILMSL